MSRDATPAKSIAQRVLDDTYIQGESIGAVRDDLRRAEAERLRDGQKRADLLDSLRRSVGRLDGNAAEARDAKRREYVRLLRDGAAAGVTAVAKRIRRELRSLDNRKCLSRESRSHASRFAALSNRYLEKVKLQESIERRLEMSHLRTSDPSLVLPQLESGAMTPHLRDLMERLVKLAVDNRRDLVRLMRGMLTAYNQLERRVAADLEEEQDARMFFVSCLQCLGESERRAVMARFNEAAKGAEIDKRTALYHAMTERIARVSPLAAETVHRAARVRALGLVREGRDWDAVQQLWRAVQINDCDPQTHRALLGIYRRLGNKRMALAAMLGLLRHCPDDTRLRARAAAELEAAGEDRQAADEYETLLGAEPENHAASAKLAGVYMRLGEYAKAAALYSALLRVQPGDPDWLTGMGEALARMGEWRRAAPYLLEARRIDPRRAGILERLVNACRKSNQHGLAVKLLTGAIEGENPPVSLLVLLGSVHRDLGNWREAKAAFEKALERNAPPGPLCRACAEAAEALGETDDALLYYERCIRADPDGREGRFGEARLLSRLGGHAEAVERLRGWIGNHPDDREAWQLLSVAYTAMGEWGEASEALKHAASLQS